MRTTPAVVLCLFAVLLTGCGVATHRTQPPRAPAVLATGDEGPQPGSMPPWYFSNAGEGVTVSAPSAGARAEARAAHAGSGAAAIAAFRRARANIFADAARRGRPLAELATVRDRHPITRGVKADVPYQAWVVWVQGPVLLLGPVGSHPSNPLVCEDIGIYALRLRRWTEFLQTSCRGTTQAGSFLSLVPACACSAHTVLEAFSLANGRHLRNVMGIPTGGAQVADPADQADGRLWLTLTTGARCAETGTFSQCPRIAPNSCTNEVERIDPRRRTLTPLFDLPGSEQIGRAVPNPDGSMVAMSLTPCTAAHGTTGLFLRDLRSGRMRPIATSTNRCDGFGSVSWNAAGTEVTFPYDKANGRGFSGPGGGWVCPTARDHLAIAFIRRADPQRTWALIAPDRGCQFRSAAFDQAGVVGIEGCTRGGPPGFSSTSLGDAYLLQLDQHHRVIRRDALKRGLEDGLVASIPHTAEALITQDQPANNGTPEDDWVWELNGTRLRPIAHYRANDAAQVIAVP